MEQIKRVMRFAQVIQSPSRLALAGVCLAAVAMMLAGGSTAEAKPVGRSFMRAERRAARALAVPSRPVPSARTDARSKQIDPRRAASPPAAKPPLPAAEAKAAAAKTPAKLPASSESGVQRATFESASPTEDGTVSVLVRPEEAAASADLQPLAFPEAPAKPAQ